MKTRSIVRTALSACVAMAAWQSQAAELEEIIVTAQKREESLQKVPIAVSALTNEGLVRANVTRLDELGSAVSGVLVENKGGYVVPKVRGVGTIIAGSGVYNAVATYVDDLYIARSYGNNFSVEEAESVQVLKGPQGALYGRNATSGAIVVKTRDPEVGAPLTGKFSLGYAEFDEVSASGRLAVGLGEKAAFSISGYSKGDDGKFRAISTSQRLGSNDRIDETDEWGVNAKLVFEPTDTVRAVLRVAHSDYQNRYAYDNTADQEILSAADLGRIVTASAPGGPLDAIGLGADEMAAAGMNTFEVFMATGIFGAFGFPAPAALALAQQTTASPRFGRVHDNIVNTFDLGYYDAVDAQDSHGGFLAREDTYASLGLTFNLACFDLISATGFRTGSQGSAADVGDIDPASPGAATLLAILAPAGINNLGVGFTGQFENEDFQQEIRLQSNENWSWQWIVGAHYFKEEADRHDVSGNGFGGFTINTENQWENESISVFGQVTFPLTEQLSFTAGGRLTQDEYELTDVIDFANPGGPLAATTAAIGPLGTLTQHENLETYLARFEYQADTWMVYAGTSTGVKSGSLNNDGPAFGRADPEELTSYEVGFKSEWLDNALQVNGAVYHYEYEKPHIVFLDQASGGQQLLNASDATVNGVDLDVVALVGDNTQVFVNTTILDSEYDDDTSFRSNTAAAVSTLASDGNDIAGAPDFTIVAGLDYRVPLVTTGELFITPSVKYTGGYYYDVENRTGTGGGGSDADDDYTVVNLNVRYTTADSHWTATLWAKNLFDEEYYSTGQIASGLLFLSAFGDPRQIGASISYEF